jgi:hypothetical protein
MDMANPRSQGLNKTVTQRGQSSLRVEEEIRNFRYSRTYPISATADLECAHWHFNRRASEFSGNGIQVKQTNPPPQTKPTRTHEENPPVNIKLRCPIRPGLAASWNKYMTGFSRL